MKADMLLAALILWLGGCEQVGDACDSTPLASSVTGTIVVGKEVVQGTQVTIPHKVAVAIETDVLLAEVTIGGAPAQRTVTSQVERWEVELGLVDLERNRVGDKSVFEAVAVDLCGGLHPVDSGSVPLGPAPGLMVSDLVLVEEHQPPGDCSVSSTGSAPLITVTASAASVGASVTLSASSGTFGGAGQTTLTLRSVNGHAERSASYVPAVMEGDVVISASGNGDEADPLVLHVVGAPMITAPETTLRRDVGYHATVSTRGNLDSCLVEEGITGTSEVKAVSPDFGVISGVTSVKSSTMSCGDLERVIVQIKFDADAPDGASATLRCFDTHGAAASQTFRVVSSMPPES